MDRDRDTEVHRLVDHLFRRQAGQLVSTLTRIFGADRLDLAEEVVQDALLRALQRWPFDGVPAEPAAWLARVARNRALDRIRRERLHREKETEGLRARGDRAGPVPEATFAGELADDQLRMIFLCCHPALSREARVALTLNTVAGFGAAEIARAFLAETPTVAQRLVRAKRRLRELDPAFEVPTGPALRERLDAVLDVLYLLFSEGHLAGRGEAPVRAELCAEAIRLASLVAAHPETGLPRTHALLALFLLQAARIPARLDTDGGLILLDEQDRTLWDHGMIARGFRHLALAAEGDEESAYHLQAAIAACHAAAPTFEATDWPAILALYDRLLALAPTPVVAVHRAVALAMVRGPVTGIRAIDEVRDDPALARYPLVAITLGELHRRAGATAAAERWLREALALPCSPAERRFVLERLDRRDAST